MIEKDVYSVWDINYKRYITDYCDQLEDQVREYESKVLGLQRANISWENEYKKLLADYKKLEATRASEAPTSPKKGNGQQSINHKSDTVKRGSDGRYIGNNQAEKIYYYHTKGYSNAQIARHLNIKIDSVRRSIDRYKSAHGLTASSACT